MTILEAILSRPRQALLSAILLLLTAQMYLLFAAFRDRRRRAVRLSLTLHFLFSFSALYLSLTEISWKTYHADSWVPKTNLPGAFGELPVRLLGAYLFLSAALAAAAFVNLIRYRRSHLTPQVIKEAMDLLPTGIAFGREDGTVLFRNLAINRLSRALTGRDFTRMDDFRRAAGHPETGSTETPQVISVNDPPEVWQLATRRLDTNGETVLQLTATDISKPEAITRELEAKNAKLRELHMRLDIYNQQAKRIIIEQEILTARMAVHNELGNVLLESLHYMKDPDSYREEQLLQTLKNANYYLLREYEADDTARDPLTEALSMAEAIGVEAQISGIPPEGEPNRGILAAAIRECATNTVKHADGNLLQAEIRRENQETELILRSNGAPPAGEIRESGGLKSLRTLVEKHQGSMQAESAPGFQLTIRLPAQKL